MGRAAPILLAALLVSVEPAASTVQDSYSKVQPVLAKYCFKCHGAQGKPKADLNLTAFTSEDAVRANRKVWKEVLSKLISREMPPDDAKPQPTEEERTLLSKWVEAALNKVDPKAPLNPGRVTARRLNRTEYSNTVRDLFAVDFDPAEDFPSDDIGFGFDNIGDVLTLSPVLMERYLAAAEAIVQRVFLADVPKPPEKHTGAKYLEPAGNSVPQSRYRPVTSEKGDGIRTGPLFTDFRIDPDGEYVFKFRAFAPKGAVKVALLACGKDVPNPASDADASKLSGAALNNIKPFRILETFEVKATEEKKADKFETKITGIRGIRRLAIALVKQEGKPKAPEKKPDEKDPKAPQAEAAPEVHIEGFALTGPLDPRPPFQRRIMASLAGKSKADQTKEILKGVASRAFRRPVTDAELARLTKVVESGEARGGKWESGIQIALQAILVSPKFLFRVELDDRPDTPEAHPINEHQLASRLSYFLWSTMPDDELLALAGKGQLTANLEAQVRRMLKDPRSQSLVENFAVQWLQIRRLHFVSPDGALFPSFNNKLREDMLQETELFVGAVFREDRSILDLIDGDFSFLNERLARHYGINDTAGNRAGEKNPKSGGQPIRGEAFVRVTLPGDRGGLITQGSVLTVTSNPTRTSPVKRGKWVLEQILGTPPPPPPPNVPEFPENAQAVQSGSLRQRMEQHRANPACANCHKNMDSIGFALENYNAVGAWRAKDGSFEIDPAGTFSDGASFKGFPELRKILMARKDQFARCLAEKMMIYALGRGLEPYDERPVDRILTALAKDKYKFSTLVVEIVKSDPFRLRRGKNIKE